MRRTRLIISGTLSVAVVLAIVLFAPYSTGVSPLEFGMSLLMAIPIIDHLVYRCTVFPADGLVLGIDPFFPMLFSSRAVLVIDPNSRK